MFNDLTTHRYGASGHRPISPSFEQPQRSIASSMDRDTFSRLGNAKLQV
jgi:hypothetical protein